MLSLTAQMITALGATISQPGLFVQLGFTSPVRLCDRANGSSRVWNSLTWTVADLNVSDYSLDNGIVQRLTLSMFDSDNAILSLLLNQNAPDLSANVWYFDSTATATTDPVLIFDGLMDNPSGGDNRRISIPCALSNKQMPVGMLAHVLPEYMFAQEGRELAWGNGKVTLSRRGEYR